METRRSRRERAAAASGADVLPLDPDPTPAARAVRPRSRATVTSVLGELLLTAGVVTLLFAGWQMWISPEQRLAESNADGQALSALWDAQITQPVPVETADVEPPGSAEDPIPAVDIPIPARPVGTEIFANMLIPRFGEGYSVNIAGGTTRSETLDLGRIGLYETSRMPGELGNFSVAGHRTSLRSTAAFRHIDALRLNDPIVVETAEGWYTYRYRSTEYVVPTQVEVLADVPQIPGLSPDERYITLTACSPLYTIDERIIAYGVFESFQPRQAGPPASLSEEVT